MPEKAQSRARSLIYNSLLLSAAAILMRAVGVSFSVWISNRVGAEVMGLYSLCTGVWGFALTLATSGVNLAATRTVAQALGAGEERGGGNARAALRRALLYAAGFGTLAALLLIFSAKAIGLHILGDARTVRPLRLLGISLPAISVSSALSGYFSAVRRVWKSALSQVCEQAVKIFAVSALLVRLLPLGVEWCCTALVLGGAISEIFSCLVGAILYVSDLRRHIGNGKPTISGRESTRRLLSTALPVAFSAYVRSGLTTVEHILIPSGLEKYGATRGGALAEYGMLNAMVMPVVMFPYAVIYSFTGLLVPELTAAASLDQRHRISYISGRVWRLTIIFGTGVAGLLICFADELGYALYGSADAARFIRLLGPLMPVMYLDTVTDSMLKGLGEQVYTMNVNIADAALSAGLVWILVPRYGISGYIAVLDISELINFALSAARLLRVSAMRPRVLSWVFAPVLCVIGAASTARMLLMLLPPVPEGCPAWLTLTCHMGLTLVLFTLLLRATGCVDTEISVWLRRSLGIRRKKEEMT